MSNARDKANIPALNFSSTGIDDNATSTAITITSAENIGIGTASPSQPLHVYSTANQIARFETNVTEGRLSLKDATGEAILKFRNDFRFTNSSGELVRIDSSGNVGIGTTSPANNLHIFTDASGEGILVKSTGNTYNDIIGDANRSSAGNNLVRFRGNWNGNSVAMITFDAGSDTTNKDNADIVFHTASSGTLFQRMKISESGNVGIGTSSPRAKLDLGAGSGDSSTISTTASDYQLILEAPQGTGDYGRNIGWCVGTSSVNVSINAVDTGSSDKTGLAFVTGDISGVAEAVRISHDGKVGIGTTSPTRTLHVDASGGANVEISRTGQGGLYFESDGTNAITRSTSATGSLIFQTNGNNERMRINSSGVVTVGKTNAGYDVAGVTLSNGGYGAFTQAGNPALILNRLTNEGTIVEFRQANGLRGTISVGGSATAYNTSSDYRLKENVNYDFDATSRLKELKPARFNFIEEADKTVDGFLAHEVSSIVPEAITGTKDAVDEDGNPDYQGIDQSKLVPLLVKTIQELEARITTLEANNP